MGLGCDTSLAWANRIDVLTTVPAGSRQPPISAGAVTLRAVEAMTVCRRIPSLRTASKNPSSPPTAAQTTWLWISGAWASSTTSGQGGGGCLMTGQQQRDELVAKLGIGQRLSRRVLGLQKSG